MFFLLSGGAADVCELMPNDEIISINGAELANHYQESVQLAINQAARAGHIELRIRRSFEKGNKHYIASHHYHHTTANSSLPNLPSSILYWSSLRHLIHIDPLLYCCQDIV